MAKKRRGQSAAFMRSINPNLRHRRTSRKLNKRRNSTMVKHRRMSKRRSHRSSSSGGKQNIFKTLMYAAGYGLVRNPLANMTAPIVNKVVQTPYNDHIGNGVVAFAAMKFGKGMIREVGKVALIAEAASAATGINFMNLGGQTQSSGYVFN
jgi:hypothetical protein